MARHEDRMLITRSTKTVRHTALSIVRRSLLLVAIVASLALTADQVRAGSPRMSPDASLSISLPAFVLRPFSWAGSLPPAGTEAAALSVFGVCLLGCARAIAKNRPSQTPAQPNVPSSSPRPLSTRIQTSLPVGDAQHALR